MPGHRLRRALLRWAMEWAHTCFHAALTARSVFAALAVESTHGERNYDAKCIDPKPQDNLLSSLSSRNASKLSALPSLWQDRSSLPASKTKQGRYG